jgi:hypothetical protein
MVSAGLVTVGTDAEDRETWILTIVIGSSGHLGHDHVWLPPRSVICLVGRMV